MNDPDDFDDEQNENSIMAVVGIADELVLNHINIKDYPVPHYLCLMEKEIFDDRVYSLALRVKEIQKELDKEIFGENHDKLHEEKNMVMSRIEFERKRVNFEMTVRWKYLLADSFIHERQNYIEKLTKKSNAEQTVVH